MPCASIDPLGLAQNLQERAKAASAEAAKQEALRLASEAAAELTTLQKQVCMHDRNEPVHWRRNPRPVFRFAGFSN